MMMKNYNVFAMFVRVNLSMIVVVKQLKDDDFRKLVQSLNIEQKELFYHVLNSVKTSNQPLRLFLSGGAGVGKSTVIQMLCMKHYNI